MRFKAVSIFTYIVCAAVLAIAVAMPARAASIQSIREGDFAAIIVSGEIVHGDEIAFTAELLRAVERGERPVVILGSRGGRLSPAFAMGRLIHRMGLSTAVSDTLCTSACALIWSAGATKFLTDGAQLGFHQAYDGRSGEAVPQGNADVAAYLAEVGASADLMAFAITARPDAMAYLSIDRARSFGIAVRRLDGAGGSARTAYAPAPRRDEGPFDDRPDAETLQRAISNVSAAYEAGGTAKLVAASRACWDRVAVTGSARSYQYCVVLDVTAEYLINRARRSSADQPPRQIRGAEIRARVARNRRFVTFPQTLPDDPLAVWGRQAYAVLGG